VNANELLARFSEQDVAAFFLVLTRISPLFLLAPLFSSKMVPLRAKSVIAVALALGLTPVVKHGTIDTDPFGFALLVVKELIVGLAYAYTLSALFAALAAAGAIIDTLIGFSFGSLLDPISGNQSTVISQMYSLFGTVIFIAIGGDGWVVKGLARTYDAVPLLSSPQIGSLVHGAQIAFSGVLLSAVMIAGPVMLALVLTDAAFGIVSRVVPQMNIFAVGFPAKMLVGFLIIGASLPFVSGFIADQLQLSIADALHALHAS
jgi:flagellar biosynthesis protein FliR